MSGDGKEKRRKKGEGKDEIVDTPGAQGVQSKPNQRHSFRW
jgi:hypothetical protein